LTDSTTIPNLNPSARRAPTIKKQTLQRLPSFDTAKVLRALYAGRLILALVLYLASVAVWVGSNSTGTMIVSLGLVGAIAFTAISWVWTDLRQNPVGTGFLYLQAVFDMVLVTTAVHVTWSAGHSQLAPLYILVIAVSALLLPASGVPLVASFGMVLYFADVMLAQSGEPDTGLVLQLLVFAIVAFTSAVIAARLRAAGNENEQMAAELAAFRLKEGDIRRLTLRAERLEGVAEMSASLAHEIKNPLASIRSAVEQLSRMPRASEDEQVLSSLVQRESDRIARVLTEFLDFARAGKTRVTEIDIAGISRNAARLVAAQPGIADGVSIVDRFPPTPMVIEGDEDLLHRAIFNLLLNAVQASPPNRAVVIEGGLLQKHQLPGDPEFAAGAYGIVVIDQGPGIAPLIRDRLFDPFVTTRTGGSGLGLSIVQRAVQAHGGLITVSPPGEETRFTIVLPKGKQALTHATSGVAADRPHHRRRVSDSRHTQDPPQE
jgi:signal transduction histidine kinase